MRRVPAVILLSGLTALTAGCLALMPVSTHIDRGADFTRYSTYAWGPADALPVSDPRLRDNPFLIDDLHGAIDSELQSRGLVPAIVTEGDAGDEILRAAASNRVDLIVMGAHAGRAGLLGFGSTTHDVLRAATCPVLSVKA